MGSETYYILSNSSLPGYGSRTDIILKGARREGQN